MHHGINVTTKNNKSKHAGGGERGGAPLRSKQRWAAPIYIYIYIYERERERRTTPVPASTHFPIHNPSRLNLGMHALAMLASFLCCSTTKVLLSRSSTETSALSMASSSLA